DVMTFGKYLGGSATNIAVAAARPGRSASVITRTGNDPFGRFVHHALKHYGVGAHGWVRRTWAGRRPDPRRTAPGALTGGAPWAGPARLPKSAKRPRGRQDDTAADRRPGAGPVPGGPAHRARRGRAAAVRRLLRHLRSREPGRPRPGAARSRTRPARLAALLPGQERAGHGARRGGVRPGAGQAFRLRLHLLDRPRRDEHGPRGGAGHDQPAAGAAAAR